MVSRAALATVSSFLLTACGAPAAVDDAPEFPGTALEADEIGAPPRIVLAVVLDQIGTSTVARVAPLLRPEGLFARAHREGAVHERVRLELACTNTAPGHAAIATGRAPRESGVVSNDVWCPRRGRVVATVDDGVSAVLGVPGRFASPSVLTADGVSDQLRAAHPGARIAALSLKERGAVIPGGRSADLVLWYEPTLRGFTTSTWYAPTTPPWLGAWERAHAFDAVLAPWTPLDPAALEARGPDLREGEGDWLGLGATFPHDPPRSTDPARAVLPLPALSERMLDLALEAARQLEMGQDDVPDLLFVSVSGTDYAGHVWGPGSWELADHLVRVDLALARLVGALEAIAPTAVLVTADHGVTEMPEHSGIAGAARVSQASFAAALEGRLDERLGPGDWVVSFVQPLVHLDVRVPQAARATALEELRAAASRHPAVHRAFTREDARGDDPLARRVARSWPVAAGGDLFVVMERGAVIDPDMPGDAGTHHGTPWEDDTDVPVLLVGASVRRAHHREVQEQRRVAATLAALLGVPSPVEAEPLEGAMSPATPTR